MTGVVDVELFHGEIIKELAICTSTFSRCISFLPPKHLEVNKKSTKVNSYLSAKLHKIQWLSGQFSYEDLSVVVNLFTVPGVQLYAKGSVKCRILSEIFQREIKNLEELGCPAIAQFDKISLLCEAYPVKHRNNLHCAQRKAKTFYSWLQTHSCNNNCDVK